MIKEIRYKLANLLAKGAIEKITHPRNIKDIIIGMKLFKWSVKIVPAEAFRIKEGKEIKEKFNRLMRS